MHAAAHGDRPHGAVESANLVHVDPAVLRRCATTKRTTLDSKAFACPVVAKAPAKNSTGACYVQTTLSAETRSDRLDTDPSSMRFRAPALACRPSSDYIDSCFLGWIRVRRVDAHRFAIRSDIRYFFRYPNIEVLEKWLPKWVEDKKQLISVAVYEIATGRFLYRTRYSLPMETNGRLTIDRNHGAVHAAGVFVNWPLLVFCQIVLAVPLVGLWLFGVWRRRRRMKRHEM